MHIGKNHLFKEHFHLNEIKKNSNCNLKVQVTSAMAFSLE